MINYGIMIIFKQLKSINHTHHAKRIKEKV